MATTNMLVRGRFQKAASLTHSYLPVELPDELPGAGDRGGVVELDEPEVPPAPLLPLAPLPLMPLPLVPEPEVAEPPLEVPAPAPASSPRFPQPAVAMLSTAANSSARVVVDCMFMGYSSLSG